MEQRCSHRSRRARLVPPKPWRRRRLPSPTIEGAVCVCGSLSFALVGRGSLLPADALVFRGDAIGSKPASALPQPSWQRNFEQTFSAFALAFQGVEGEGLIGGFQRPRVSPEFGIHDFETFFDPAFGHHAVDGVDGGFALKFGTDQFKDVHSSRKFWRRCLPSRVRIDSG